MTESPPTRRRRPAITRPRRDANVERMLIGEDRIARRVRQLARHIERDFAGRDLVIWKLRPRRVRVCVLLEKTAQRRVPVRVHYVGFRVPNRFRRRPRTGLRRALPQPAVPRGAPAGMPPHGRASELTCGPECPLEAAEVRARARQPRRVVGGLSLPGEVPLRSASPCPSKRRAAWPGKASRRGATPSPRAADPSPQSA